MMRRGTIWYLATGIAVASVSFYLVPSSEQGIFTAFDAIRDALIVLFLWPLVFPPSKLFRRRPGTPQEHNEVAAAVAPRACGPTAVPGTRRSADLRIAPRTTRAKTPRPTLLPYQVAEQARRDG